MQAYTVFLVNQHIEQLRIEAAQRRVHQGDRPGLGARIAATFQRIRRSLTTPAPSSDPSIPALSDLQVRRG